MFVPGLFQMTRGYISYYTWVIYVCPRAIFHIVPGSYMFVPGIFKITQGYIFHIVPGSYMRTPENPPIGGTRDPGKFLTLGPEVSANPGKFGVIFGHM
jgi:hypothetical protein